MRKLVLGERPGKELERMCVSMFAPPARPDAKSQQNRPPKEVKHPYRTRQAATALGVGSEVRCARQFSRLVRVPGGVA